MKGEYYFRFLNQYLVLSKCNRVSFQPHEHLKWSLQTFHNRILMLEERGRGKCPVAYLLQVTSAHSSGYKDRPVGLTGYRQYWEPGQVT